MKLFIGKRRPINVASFKDASEAYSAIRARGLERPTGEYLMSKGDRIDWETGDWSPGWDWKKREAARQEQPK